MKLITRQHQNRRQNQRGFTIVELMIATLVFSIILLVISTGIIQIGRFYYKNITSARTQEAARNIVEEVSRTAQFSEGGIFPSSNVANPAFCIGQSRFSYVLDRQVSDTQKGLLADTMQGNNCIGQNLSTASTVVGTDLLSTNMRLLNFEVTEDSSSNTVKVKVRVAYGDNDLLTNYPDNAGPTTPPTGDPKTASCKTGIAGSSFCSVSELESTVKRR